MEEVKRIAAQVFSVDISMLNDDFGRDNADEWDSFNHLLLISEIERITGIKFTMQEVEQINNIRQLTEIISNKKVV